MKKAPVTIKDIASELGLSPSTVSRALADNPLVKSTTREAVKNLASLHKYKPNFTALSLKSNETKTIGVIIPQIVHEFFALVIRGIEEYCYDAGYSVIISATHQQYDREVADTANLMTGRVDGLLACVSRETEKYDHFQAYVDRGIPIAFFDSVCAEIDAFKIIIDDQQAGFDATMHLIQQGCQRLGFIGGSDKLIVNRLRLEGFKKAAKKSGIRLNDEWIVHCREGDYQEGIDAAKSILKDRPFVDGLVCTNDMLAVGAIKYMKKIGLKAPEDIAVIGFSDWSISSLYEPSISTIYQPGYDMGFRAAELLIHQIKNPDSISFTTEILKTELIQRESSTRL